MQFLPENVYSVSQIRELERIMIDEEAVSDFELMTRAGRAAFGHLRTVFPFAKRIIVLCGAGNNAGDGFIVAALCKVAELEVRVCLLNGPEIFVGAALKAFGAYVDGGGDVIRFHPDLTLAADLFVDAILGTGLTRELTGNYLAVIEAINLLQKNVMALDIPSGLHADTGNAMPIALKATTTVTFIGLKRGLLTADAPEYTGDIVCVDLDVAERVFARVPTICKRVHYESLPKRHRCAHKGNNGHVLIIGGERGFSGAVMLAGEAALRVGSGLVTIATRPEHAALLNLTRPELMCHAVETAQDLENLVDKSTVIVIGPGLGQSDWAVDLLRSILAATKPLIIDADGLNLIARLKVVAPENSNWVLTPHPGEASRLLGVSTQEIHQDRFSAILALQQKFRGVIVLKGAGTLIVDTNQTSIVSAGNPGMATGGMGDVLSGVIAGLIAQNIGYEFAVQQGVLLHAMAADQAGLDAGERGLLARDLMPYLRKLVN